MKRTRLPVLLALAALAGCTSFRLAQTDAFVDDDGNAIVVEYGASA